MDAAEEELTEQEKMQFAYRRKSIAAERKTQKEDKRHLQKPETQALLGDLRKILPNEAK